MKTDLKIKFTDFYPGFVWNGHCLWKYLNRHFNLIPSDKPDILIFSCFGTEFLKYDCPRIFYTAENIRPDFRFCDFAVSFDFLDDSRHIRLPLYSVYYRDSDLTKIRDVDKIISEKEGFCSFVVSNALESEERIRFFNVASQKMEVASGGKYANNVGGPVPNKLAFIKKYLFNISFENSQYPGYSTEKIAEAWMAGCVPVYWGDPKIKRCVNPDCFINVDDYSSYDEVIDFMKEIYGDKKLQKHYLSAPFFANNVVPQELSEDNISNRLKLFIEKALENLPKKASKKWHKPYYYLRKVKGFSRLVKINLR